MCEHVAEALAGGDGLSEAQALHLAGCARCQGARRIAVGWRPARVSTEVEVSARRTRSVVRVRRARVGLLVMTMATLVWLWPRPAPPPEPDLIAVLDDVEAVLGPDAAEDDLDALFEPSFNTFDLGDL